MTRSLISHILPVSQNMMMKIGLITANIATKTINKTNFNLLTNTGI